MIENNVGCANVTFEGSGANMLARFMKRASLYISSLLALTAVCQAASDTRTPVLLELFTSEGCSSCPPADQLLTKLDRQQPIKDVDLIVIGEHVDYWNRGGWVDQYSSESFTERQQRYASLLHVPDIYTPQLVIDGVAQVVGANWPDAKAAIERAQRARKLIVSLEQAPEHKLTVKVNADPSLPAGDVYLALAADSMQTQIKGGENSGRHLVHTAVAYSIKGIGRVGSETSFEKTINLPEHAKWGGRMRTIVFVQDLKSGHILGSAALAE